jgi:hypothetical protein
VALREGEEVIARAEISVGIYWKTIAVLALAIIIGLLAWQLGVLLLIVTVLMFLYAFAIRHALFLVVTNQRIFVRAGIIKVDTVQLRLDRIESVEIQRTIPGQIFNYATLMVSGTGAMLAFIPFMSNAQQIRDIIDEMLYKREEKPQHVIVEKAPTTEF